MDREALEGPRVLEDIRPARFPRGRRAKAGRLAAPGARGERGGPVAVEGRVATMWDTGANYKY